MVRVAERAIMRSLEGSHEDGLQNVVSGEWSPACVAIPRRGYWRVRVVPGGETRGVCGFQPSRSWEWFVGIDLGVFPRVSVG